MIVSPILRVHANFQPQSLVVKSKCDKTDLALFQLLELTLCFLEGEIMEARMGDDSPNVVAFGFALLFLLHGLLLALFL